MKYFRLLSIACALLLPFCAFAQQGPEDEEKKLYEMIQTALYMGFSEIYIYGFDGLFVHEYDENGIGRLPAEGVVPDFPAKSKELLGKIKTYAENHNVRIVNMCETAGLSMFEHAAFADIDFTTSSIFGRI